MDTLYRVPLKEASEATKHWRNSQKINAYAIDKQELLDVIAENEMDAMRVYFGLDKDGKERMFLVAAEKIKDKFGKVILIKDLIDEDPLDGNSGHYVYDFTAPCPNTCDDESPLMN
jgi:hypothetical protein